MADINITEAELTELRKKAHAFDSEQGRLQKTQQELEAERAKRAELETRMASQQATQTQAPIDTRAAEVFGADGVNILQGILAPVLGKLDTIGKKFEERDTQEAQARAQQKFQGELGAKLADSNLPGFESRIYGGDLASAWAKFVETRPSIRRAQLDGDVEAVSDMVTIFVHQNKELVAGGFSPSAVSGQSPVVKSDYGDADYMRDVKALQRQLDNLAITEEDFNKQTAQLYDRYAAAQEKAERAAVGYGLV